MIKPLSLVKRIIQIHVLAFLILSTTSFSQDTSSAKEDTKDFVLLSMNSLRYINADNPDTISRKRFLWYPLKNFDDIFNYLPGYYLKFMDEGQVNHLSFNQLDQHYTALLRNGRPLNDLLDGSVDFNLLSRNEIEELELSNGFGNFLYDYSNGINVINHQVLRYKPYSEISYWQDRFENLYFDGSYHQNIFRKFNFNFGITKHSYDGKYTNSDFDKWQGRFNLNFFPGSRFNSFLYFNYTKIQRGLNEGIDPGKSALDKNTLFDESLAIVKNPDAYEIRERFDADMGFIYAYGKKRSSFTKLQLFTSNSFRKYRDEENRPLPNGIFFKDNSHWINYGAKIQQVVNFNFTKTIKAASKTEFEFNSDLITSNIVQLRSSDRIYFLENLDLISKYFSVNAYAKAFKHKFFEDKFYFDYGVMPAFMFSPGKDFSFTVYGIYSKSNKLPTYQQYFLDKYIYNEEPVNKLYNEDVKSLGGGIKLKFSFGELKAEYYDNTVSNYIFNNTDSIFYLISHRSIKSSGLNSMLNIRLFNFDLDVNLTNRFYRPEYWISRDPEFSGNVSLAYHSIFFKNKLEVKIGLLSRFWSEFYAEFYNGFYNDFSPRLYRGFGLTDRIKINPNATLDFFIIGKINKATFGLTFENMLNRLYITSGIYPNQDRGGLLNVISRFNVTWYFLN